MMYYIESRNTDPSFNLALEQYVFDRLDRGHSYFMLWQNDNAIIVGKYQNTMGEINAAYVQQHGIRVVRRLSGGGAVYHDMGNLNFTFITDEGNHQAFDFAAFCRPVAMALASMGVTVEVSGRNDMVIQGKKFSGNAQYRKNGRIMHHGTLLFDSNLEVISNALQVSQDKIESKGVKSVKSRVTNIKPYLQEDVSVADFWAALRDYMMNENSMEQYILTEQDQEAVVQLREQVYSTWDWNYGASPACSIQKQRRIEGCGKVECYLNVGHNGLIQGAEFFGDYFGNGDSGELAQLIKDCPLEEGALRQRLADISVGDYFNNLGLEEFLSILLQ